MVETVEKKEKKTSLQHASKELEKVLSFEERMVRLRLQKSKEKSFLLLDKPSK